MPIEFSMNVLEFGSPNPVSFTGRGIDRSENGLGFVTSFKLEPGFVIEIRQEDGSVRTAEVQWVGELDGRLRVGVLLYNDINCF
ncbi:MAG: hypothetical protein M0024_03710 [Nitrospiraceae bacterium]|nr:hypothetical protein [Nitrospiraceae bacterium]